MLDNFLIEIFSYEVNETFTRYAFYIITNANMMSNACFHIPIYCCD